MTWIITITDEVKESDALFVAASSAIDTAMQIRGLCTNPHVSLCYNGSRVTVGPFDDAAEVVSRLQKCAQ